MSPVVKRKSSWPLSLAILGGTTALALVCIFSFRPHSFSETPPGPVQPFDRDATPSVSPGSAAIPLPLSTPAASWPPEEVFRRAFWRQPSPQDHIVHAQRRETLNGQVLQGWQWFLEIHPGPELLRTLRDPETFGLLPVATPRPWGESAPSPESAPAWFPAIAPAAAGFEVLQAPSGHLTLLYRAKDNTLFATDAGAGFAPAAKPLTKSRSP